MANNLLTISKITNEALMVLENELTFTSEVDRNYDDHCFYCRYDVTLFL